MTRISAPVNRNLPDTNIFSDKCTILVFDHTSDQRPGTPAPIVAALGVFNTVGDAHEYLSGKPELRFPDGQYYQPQQILVIPLVPQG